MSDQQAGGGSQQGEASPAAHPAAPDHSPSTTPDASPPTAADPEDWQSTAAAGDDERYLRERPPHWQ